MLQGILSDLQTPEMSPGHASGMLTPGGKINSVINTLTGNGQLSVADPLWICSCSLGPSCRSSIHLSCYVPISSGSGTQLNGQATDLSFLSALLLKRSCFVQQQTGLRGPAARHWLQRERGCKQYCIIATRHPYFSVYHLSYLTVT